MVTYLLHLLPELGTSGKLCPVSHIHSRLAQVETYFLILTKAISDYYYYYYYYYYYNGLWYPNSRVSNRKDLQVIPASDSKKVVRYVHITLHYCKCWTHSATFLDRVLQGFVNVFDNTGTHSDLHSKSTARRLRLKCDGTRAETRFRLSAKRTSPFKSAGGVSSVDYWQPRCAHQR